ncbi:uncharacterized protein LOC141719739 [Apium graveolens]|uniref:uncharacterized protein LOC141719739 n=1 Tax=Apium graveolens TaxID=4045 RepID=UPI003D7B14E9
MEPPHSIKDVQKLTRRISALGRFISKFGDKYLPFFKTLIKVKNFKWTAESQKAFERLNKYMTRASLLAKPNTEDIPYLYITVSEQAVTIVLFREGQEPQSYGDSRLIVTQVNVEFEAKDDIMAKYLRVVKGVLTYFDEWYTGHVSREENTMADALSNCWISPIKAHIDSGWLPDDAREARKLSVRALRYSLIKGLMYKRSFIIPHLKCLRSLKVEEALKKAHEEICGQHLGGRALAHKITRLGFYRPIMSADAKAYVKKCDRCQRHSPIENGKAEVANRIILDGLKKRVERSINTWVDELFPILWAYRTTCKVTTEATPFMLTYGAEEVVPLEITH